MSFENAWNVIGKFFACRNAVLFWITILKLFIIWTDPLVNQKNKKHPKIKIKILKCTHWIFEQTNVPKLFKPTNMLLVWPNPCRMVKPIKCDELFLNFIIFSFQVYNNWFLLIDWLGLLVCNWLGWNNMIDFGLFKIVKLDCVHVFTFIKKADL